MNRFNGRLAIQQRVLPAYRAPFFDLLAQNCTGGVVVFAGQPLDGESIPTIDSLDDAQLTRTVNRHILQPHQSLYLCYQAGLPDWLDREQPDVLVIEANPRYPDNRLAIRAMHLRGLPVLGWGLGAPPAGGVLSRLRARARANLLRTLDGLIAYSRRGAQEYSDLGILPPERIFTAPNAVAPRPSRPAPDRGRLQQPLSILFVGRLQARKLIDFLIEACARLPVAIQPKLTIVGDGPERPSLEALAAKRFPHAIFTGQLHGRELEACFEAADLFVLPGTGGLAVQEAMSYALPVIVAQGDGTQDDLVRPSNGWQLPSGDLQALVRTLEIALGDPGLRAKGLESRRIVAEEINLQAMAGRFLEAVSRVFAALQ